MNRKGIPNWTPEEVEYLRTAWGTTSYEGMAKTLNRSVDGIRQKASKLGLGQFYGSGEYVTLNQQCRAIYADSFTLKPISGQTTTPKAAYCENCKRKFSHPADLKQYVVTAKGGR